MILGYHLIYGDAYNRKQNVNWTKQPILTPGHCLMISCGNVRLAKQYPWIETSSMLS